MRWSVGSLGAAAVPRDEGRLGGWGIACAAGLGRGSPRDAVAVQQQHRAMAQRAHECDAASCRAAKAGKETACSSPLLQLHSLSGC